METALAPLTLHRPRQLDVIAAAGAAGFDLTGIQFQIFGQPLSPLLHDPDFVVSAWSEEGEIMGVRHRTWPLHGVQFHPESFLTLEGPKLLKNFLAT